MPKKFILISVCCLALIGFVSIKSIKAAPATYYVDPFFGDDSNPGSMEAPIKTINKVNGLSLNPGDSVLFKRGGVWREKLVIPRSGEAGNYITFGAYGAGEKPIISGADVITGWSWLAGNIYYKNSLAIEPNQVFHNGNFLNEKDGGWQSLGSNEWDWNNNVLYINIGANPSGQTIEANQRQFCIESNSKNYIKYENLIVQYANEDGIYHHGWNFTGLVIDSVHARHNGNPGVDFRGIYMKGGSDITVKNSEADHNGWNGIGFSSWESTSARTGWVIENSSAHHNYHSGFDFQAGSTGINGITAKYSKGYENHHNGMYVASNSGVDISNVNIYYNAFYRNKRTGLHIDDHDGSLPFASNVKIYNNIMYYNGHESGIWGGGLAAKMTNSSVINNIFYSNQVVKGGSTEVIVNNGGGSANNFNYNLIYNPDLSNLVQWNNNYFGYSQLAPNGINANGLNNVQPVLKDPLANDFTLSASSPCIDKGFDVNLAVDMAGGQVAYNGIPDIGIYEYRPVIFTPVPTTTPAPVLTPTPTPTQKPYPGPNSHQIPGIVEAENFDQGGEGTSYHDLDTQNRGGFYRVSEGPDIESCSEGNYNIGWTTPNEWLEYTVNVAETGNYNIEIRNAVVNSGSYVKIEFNGIDKTGSILLTQTGGWQNWSTYKKTGVNLSAGNQVMKMLFPAGSGEGIANINWIKITYAGSYQSADLNSDTRVNSIDFGILMSWWGALTKPKSDINQDGYVNSVDFGIMLSQWTG